MMMMIYHGEKPFIVASWLLFFMTSSSEMSKLGLKDLSKFWFQIRISPHTKVTKRAWLFILQRRERQACHFFSKEKSKSWLWHDLVTCGTSCLTKQSLNLPCKHLQTPTITKERRLISFWQKATVHCSIDIAFKNVSWHEQQRFTHSVTCPQRDNIWTWSYFNNDVETIWVRVTRGDAKGKRIPFSAVMSNSFASIAWFVQFNWFSD